MGRGQYKKVKYDPEVHPQKAETLAEQGLINVEIARGLGIPRSLFYEWTKKHSDFSDSLRRGKEAPDAEVARAFFRNCIGYEYEETKITAVLDKNGKPTGKRVITRIKRHHPGSVTAKMHWMKLRQGHEWDAMLAAVGSAMNRVPALDKLPEHLLREIAEGRGVYHDGEVIPITEFEVLPAEEEEEEEGSA